MTDSVDGSRGSDESRGSDRSSSASSVSDETREKARDAASGDRSAPAPQEATADDRASSQDRMQSEGNAARTRVEAEMPGDSTGSAAASQEATPAADTARDMIDRNTTTRNQRGGQPQTKTVNTEKIANEVLDLSRQDPAQAVDVRQELAKQLSPEQNARFEQDMVKALTEDGKATAKLADGREVQPVDAAEVTAKAQELIDAHTKTQSGGRSGATRTVLDVNSMSYAVEELAKTDPSMAVAVKDQLSLDLPAQQAADMNRIISGGATLGENIEIAFENPIDGVKGAGKGIANGFSALGELFVKGSTYRAAGDQYRAAGYSALLGNDELAARQIQLGEELTEAARTTDFVPQFDISNRAQAGGETIGTAIDIALAGKGLVTGGAKAVAGLSDEAVALSDNVAGAAARNLPDRLTLSRAQVDEVLSVPKGARPDPSTYMTKAQIDEHLALFDEGAVRFTNRSTAQKYGTLGPDGAFVMPKSEFDRVMTETGGDLRQIEKRLGLDEGQLSNADTMVVEIARKDLDGLRVPSGNESGVNDKWLPGGYTSGNVPEAVMDFSGMPPAMEIVLP